MRSILPLNRRARKETAADSGGRVVRDAPGGWMRVCLLLLAACAAAPLRPAVGLHEVESPPAGCRPVGRFEGVSAQPGDAGMAQARELEIGRASCRERVECRMW